MTRATRRRAALVVVLGWAIGCARSPAPSSAPGYGSGELQAIVEIGDSGGMPFLAEQGVLAVLYPSPDSPELVIHAGSDLERDLDRLALALILDLRDTDLPGSIDLGRHALILMELDRSGEPEIVLDGVPTGTAEVHGTMEPGGEIYGSFSAEVPGSDELGDPLLARIDGTFSAIVGSPPSPPAL